MGSDNDVLGSRDLAKGEKKEKKSKGPGNGAGPGTSGSLTEAESLFKSYAAFNRDASSLDFIQDTKRLEGPSLSAKLMRGFPTWKKDLKRMNDTRGAPMWLILCPSAERVLAILKDLKEFRKFAKVSCVSAPPPTSSLPLRTLGRAITDPDLSPCLR